MIKKHENINQLKQLFPIPNFDENNLDHWDQLHQLSVQDIVNNGGKLPLIPPFEKHPYLEPLDINIKATGLMIGTFPPITYLCSQYNLVNLTYNNQVFTAPDLDYFHGNYSSLWKYAPIDFDHIQTRSRAQQPQLIANALNEAGILYADMVKYTQRSLNDNNKYDAGDKNLNSIILNEQLIQFLLNANGINRLYFTNASFFHSNNALFNPLGELRINDNDAFGLFLKTALDLNVKVAYSLFGKEFWVEINELPKTLNIRNTINDHLKTKVTLQLKLTFEGVEKIFNICSAVSPAAVNRGMVRRNPCVQLCCKNLNIPIADSAARLLSETLACFFNNQLHELAQYNA